MMSSVGCRHARCAVPQCEGGTHGALKSLYHRQRNRLQMTKLRDKSCMWTTRLLNRALSRLSISTKLYILVINIPLNYSETHQKTIVRVWGGFAKKRHFWFQFQNCPDTTTHIAGLCSVLRPSQHSIGYMGDGFYRSKDPTNSIKVLKVHIVHRQIKYTIIKQ